MMSAPSLPLVYFGAACATSIAFSFALGAALRRAAGRWPALHAHRSVWFLAQAAVVLVFALACAPLARSPVAPVLTLPQATAGSTVLAEAADLAPVPPASPSMLDAGGKLIKFSV